MTLAALIELHRALARGELYFPPTQRTPPVAYRFDERERAFVPDDRPLVINPFTADEIEVPDSATQSTRVGMPMSARMLRYLQGPAADTPWARALFLLKAHCRREHPYHRAADRPYWRGSLCWQLVVVTCIGKPLGNGQATVHEAAQILRYDNPEPVLGTALEWIEGAIDRERAKMEKRAREDEGQFSIYDRPPSHHAPSEEHVAECPNPECKARRAA